MTILWALFFSQVHAQYFRSRVTFDPSQIPGLLRKIENSKLDKERVNLSLKLSAIYIYRIGSLKNHLDSAMLLAVQAKALSKRLRYIPGYNEALLLIAAVYIETEQWEKAKQMVKVTTDTTKIKLLAALCDFYWYGVDTKRDTGNKRMIDTAVIFGKQAFSMSISSGRKEKIALAARCLYDVITTQIKRRDLDGAHRVFDFIETYRNQIGKDQRKGLLDLREKLDLARYRDYRSALLPKEQNPAERLRLSLKIAGLYLYEEGNQKEDLEKAMEFLKEAMTLSLAQKNQKAYNDTQVLLSGIYMESNNIKAAMKLLSSQKGETRLRILINYTGDYYYKGRPISLSKKAQLDSAILFNKEALELANNLNDKPRILSLIPQLKWIADIYGEMHMNGAKEIYEYLLKHGPREKYAQKTGIYLELGRLLSKQGTYDAAISFALKAETNVIRATPDVDVAFLYLLFAQVYSATKKYEKSNEYRLRVLNEYERFKGSVAMYSVLGNYCGDLILQNQSDKALKVIKSFYEKNPPESEMNWYYYYYTLGRIYLAKKMFADAEANLKIAVNKEITLATPISVHKDLGKLYYETKDFDKAQQSYIAAEKKTAMEHAAYRASLYYGRALTDTALNKYKSAVQYLLRERAVNDSIFSISKERHTQELVIQYQTQKKEADLKLKEENIRFLNQQALVLNQKAALLDQKAKIQQIQLDRAKLLAEKNESDFKLQEKNIKFLNQNAKLQQNKLETAQMSRNITIAFVILIVIILGLLYRQYKLKHQSNRIILSKNGMLEQLLSEKDWLLKEVHHRVKNNLQTVISLLESQAAYLQDDALKAMENCQHRIFVMSLIHQKLYQSEDVKTIDMPSYIAEFINNLADSFDVRQQIRFEQSVAQIELNVNEAMPLALILNEAVTNSIKYAFPSKTKGVIAIKMFQAGDEIEMVISDNGIGMQNSAGQSNVQSLGLRLMRGLCQDMDASIKFDTENGTTITIRFTANRLVDHRQEHLASIG